MKRFFILLLLASMTGYATHKRAGEITFRQLSASSFEITIVTYQNTGSSTVDNCEIMVHFGDGDSAFAPRINNVIPLPSCYPNGQGQNISANLKKNIYRINHNYPGAATYTIATYIRNRNQFIVNMSNSGNEALVLKTELQINPLLPNSSPILMNDPIDTACLNNCFYHNPVAIDPDGDSLSYELIPCMGSGGNVAGYFFPTAPNSISIDPLTGDLSWCSPYAVPSFSFPQMWNFAIRIREWRRDINGVLRNIGWLVRDMQVNVVQNCNNNPPQIPTLNDLCVMEGTSTSVVVSASDPQGSILTLTASGAPFNLIPPATFVSVPSVNPTGVFSWTPSCDQVRAQPYLVVVKAQDQGPTVSLLDIESFFIKVLAFGPRDLSATGSCNSIQLNWSPSSCNPISNAVIGYKIYMDESCNQWTPGSCETGVASGSGYSFVGNTFGISNCNFTVNNLTPGNYYSFRVVTEFNDGALSVASAPVCIPVLRTVPVITHVDVTATSSSLGTIDIRWINPVAGTIGLDTISYPGPYTFRLFRGSSLQIFTYTVPYYAMINQTQYTDNNFNTEGSGYIYRTELYSNANLICNAQTASSVYLSLTGSDNTISLQWTEQVPWDNYLYYVWKEMSPSVWVKIDSTTGSSYTDVNLVNGRTYCYYIEAKGQYSDPLLPQPLMNRSEIKCGIPVDLTAPCPPLLSVISQCEDWENAFSWNDPNQTCADDVVAYHLWFMSNPDADPIIIATITPATTTNFTHDSLNSVAGCYFITALDSFNNESAISTILCLDNCPNYELPNVFTPNGDGLNDLFVPFPYRYVKEVDLVIYDRWGGLVFETHDPGVFWNGKNINSGQLCSDGVYYYTCLVAEIHLNGLEYRKLSGFVHLLSNNPTR